MVKRSRFARFTPFTRGKIVGKWEEGAPRERIRKTVRKKDGRAANLRAIDGVIAHARADPDWQGENSSAGGRPQELSAEEQAKLKKLIEDEVGLARVTIAYCKKRLLFCGGFPKRV